MTRTFSSFILFSMIALLASCILEPQSGRVSPIHDIQGVGSYSPFTGEVRTISGFVTCVEKPLKSEPGKVFLQLPQEKWDKDPRSSEAICVISSQLAESVAVGDLVRCSGTIDEIGGMTVLRDISAFKHDTRQKKVVKPLPITLPWSSPNEPECYESMFVTISNRMTINDTSGFLNDGELGLSLHRVWTPTAVRPPGPEVSTLLVQNAKKQITLLIQPWKFSRQKQWSPLFPLIDYHPPRIGDAFEKVTGILETIATSEGKSVNKIIPLQKPTFKRINRRDTTPIDFDGALRIASMNLHNYFNGPHFPTSRGASSFSEFQRQQAKLVSAIKRIDADIIACQEMENDGFGRKSAIATFTRAINRSFKRSKGYRYVYDRELDMGSDDICVALLFRPHKVHRIGRTISLNIPPFGTKSRPALAQSFQDIKSKERFTVVVVHLKSKRCGEPSGADKDRHDGQGCWNATRLKSCKILLKWLHSNPTEIDTPNILILGDFNAYAMEDPVKFMEQKGLVNLVKSPLYKPGRPYSYTYHGMTGYLDYAFASTALTPKIIGITFWHVNADEPRWMDYNEENKHALQKHRESPITIYRYSDHDPLILTLF